MKAIIDMAIAEVNLELVFFILVDFSLIHQRNYLYAYQHVMN